jgi:3-mercaptopyruvate sulfurtransferase SseA
VTGQGREHRSEERARSGAPRGVLISATELLASSPAVLLDVRWALGDPHGREHYLDGHVPGAVFVDLETELAAPPSPQAGRHPLPSLQRLEASARRWGIHAGDRVVAYDATGGLAAARAWWLLRWGGLTDVRLLDGGLAAWVRAGGELQTGDVVADPGDVTLTGGGMPVLHLEEVAHLAPTGLLLDARAGERYRGEMEPVDPRPGHVPGAVSAPTTENLASDGTFRPAAELRERFTALGAAHGTTVGVYCGSGVTAAHEVAALAEAGIEAALWPGSWSQWAADPDRPAATGPHPG